jgi:hypothetical protein
MSQRMVYLQDASSHFNPDGNPHMGPDDQTRQGSHFVFYLNSKQIIPESDLWPVTEANL